MAISRGLKIGLGAGAALGGLIAVDKLTAKRQRAYIEKLKAKQAAEPTKAGTGAATAG